MSAADALGGALSRRELGPRGVVPVLTHPVWLVSLGVLALNDHVLKGSGLLPGAVTGKLSDVAGMFVAPVLLAALFRVRTARGLFYAHLAVGAGFGALEMSLTLTSWLDAAYQLAGRRWVSTKDATDLLALALLPLAYAWATRAASARTATQRPVLSRDVALAGAGLLACVATSDTDTGGGVIDPATCDFDCDMDGVDAPEDCNDFDPVISPNNFNCPGSEQEHCDDGQDNDSDGLIDCQDSKCQAACQPTKDACYNDGALTAGTGDLVGSTLLGSWALEGPCGGSDAPEVIFHISSPIPGTLRVPAPEGHVAYARRDCWAAHELSDCALPEETLEVVFTGGEIIAVIIDAENALAGGDFIIPVTFTPSGCGDGALDPATEACDDGNLVDGDGCSALCQVEADLLCGALPELELGAVDTTFEGGHTYLGSTCSDQGGISAPERGFHFVAAEAGVLTVTAASQASVGLFAQAACPGPVVACSPHVPAGAPADLSIPMEAGAEVFVYVEGTAGLLPDSAVSIVSSFEPN